MKLTDEDINRLQVEVPTKELEEYTAYGDFGNSRIVDDDVADYKELVREQARDCLEEINRLRGEVPMAIHFWEEQIDESTIRVGWVAWTDRKHQTLVPS